MERNGYPEETYYTFSYSPVPNDEGDSGGILCANTNDTARIMSERQLSLLRDLAAATAEARTTQEVCQLSARSLATNTRDLPFALIYLLEAGQQRLVLAGTSQLEGGHPAAPDVVALSNEAVGPFTEAMQSGAPLLVPNLASTFANLPTGAWDRPPTQAVVLPIAASGQQGCTGVLVAGLNPYRLYDDAYQQFLGLVAGQLSSAIGSVQAYESERARAEALAELDLAKTTFFSNVSHELRTPLTLLIGPLEDGLADSAQPLPAAQRERQEVALRNAGRLLRLVNA
jgi:GAF domain-containing protein